MDKKTTIYLAIAALFTLSSCSQDEPARTELPADGNRIYFRSYLPAVTLSRADAISALNSCQVTCFNPDDTTLINSATGAITPYFTDVCFADDGTGRFFSQGDDECSWPDKNSKMHFFAYYPSVESMKKISGDTLFNLVNSSTLTEESAIIDYKLHRFRVAGNIANQVDFLTAASFGSLSDNAASGIKLDFKHQLARVELKAWGDNDKYTFEIAGARIGNPLVEGDFNFNTLTSDAGDVLPWQNTSGLRTPVEYIFNAGEPVVLLSKDKESHASEEDAASIMGKAGAAMVIPMYSRIEAWEGKADPATAQTGYTTDKMYFSVLLSVRNSDDKVVYPYPNDRDNMAVVYFAIAKDSRMINKRLYKIDGAYYTIPVKSDESRYTPADTEEICDFGWAALPVAAKWEAGKKYTYRLNYSNGIGWHDPADPSPGEQIIERSAIPFNVSIDEWIPADEDDYTPEINVPKK